MGSVDRRRLIQGMGANLGTFAVGRHLLMGVAVSAARPGWQSDAAAPPTGASTASTLSEQIADTIVDARFDDLPRAVVERAKEQIVYHFGLAFGGSFDHKAEHMRALARQQDQHTGGATIIGEPYRLLPADAAFANCTLMRSTFRDDVLFPSGIHAGLGTLPTALALGEVHRLSGREVLLAMVLGYEVAGKLGNVINSWAAPWIRRATMVWGGYAPIVVSGRLMGLDRERMASALGYAANLGMGVPEGGQTEHYFSLVAGNATFAALLAEAGGTPGSRATIEGDLGLYQTFFGKIPVSLPGLIDDLGSDWEIFKAEQKRHHGTGQSTIAIELLLGLVRDHDLTADRVAKIDVFLPTERRFREEFVFRGPFGPGANRFSSMPYALSVALVDGKVGPGRYSDAPVDEKIARQLPKIEVTFEDGHEIERYCRLEVRTVDGATLIRDADVYEFAFPRSVWGEWLQLDGLRLLSPQQLQRLEQLIGDLESLDDVSELMATVVPSGASDPPRRNPGGHQ